MLSRINKNKVANNFDECKLYDIENGIKTINQWVNEIEFLAGKFINKDEINKFKGNMLEIFSEIFFSIYKADPSVGIREYKPIQSDEDFGVDAIGVNVNNDVCAIQVKYRANSLYESYISYGDIAKTYASAKITLNLSLDKDNTIYLFTTSGGITIPCNKVFGKKLRVINRDIISGFVDNNMTFWLEASNKIEEVFKDLGCS